MAAAYLSHLAGSEIEVRSAGSAPANSINPAVIEAMKEENIDLTTQLQGPDQATPAPKKLTDKAVELSDVVITMGCGDVCPFFPGKRYEDWVLEDPAGQGVNAVRPIRDEIKKRVEKLIEELTGEKS